MIGVHFCRCFFFLSFFPFFATPELLHITAARPATASILLRNPYFQREGRPNPSVIEVSSVSFQEGTICKCTYILQESPHQACSRYCYAVNISKHFEVINLEAMNEEHDSTSRKHVAIFVPNKNVVSCKWVYQIKENHNILHFKARLIFQGFVSTYIHLVQKAKNDSTCLIIGNVISRLVHEKVKHPISPFAVRIYITIESDKLAIIFLIH